MRFIYTDRWAIEAGEHAFNLYIAGLACGSATGAYRSSLERVTGIEMIPGAIVACLDHGVTCHEDIIRAVARATRCRRSTVADLLSLLTGEDDMRHIFTRQGDEYAMLSYGVVNGKDQASYYITA